MLSSSFDISEFIDKAKGHSGQEIIIMADREATAAERLAVKSCRGNTCDKAREYALLLKDVVLYMRHGILTHSARRLDLAQIQPCGRYC